MPIKRFRLNLFEYFSPKIGSAQLMPALQGCKISIFCDDKPLEEYSLEVLNENTATCWIPSEAGKVSQTRPSGYRSSNLIHANPELCNPLENRL